MLAPTSMKSNPGFERSNEASRAASVAARTRLGSGAEENAGWRSSSARRDQATRSGHPLGVQYGRSSVLRATKHAPGQWNQILRNEASSARYQLSRTSPAETRRQQHPQEEGENFDQGHTGRGRCCPLRPALPRSWAGANWGRAASRVRPCRSHECWLAVPSQALQSVDRTRIRALQRPPELLCLNRSVWRRSTSTMTKRPVGQKQLRCAGKYPQLREFPTSILRVAGEDPVRRQYSSSVKRQPAKSHSTV